MYKDHADAIVIRVLMSMPLSVTLTNRSVSHRYVSLNGMRVLLDYSITAHTRRKSSTYKNAAHDDERAIRVVLQLLYSFVIPNICS